MGDETKEDELLNVNGGEIMQGEDLVIYELIVL